MINSRINKNLLKAILIMNLAMLLLFVICNSLFDNGQISVINLSIFLASLISSDLGIYLFFKWGINNFSVFIILYGISLVVNTFHLSSMQTVKTIADFYYLFFGGFLFSLYLLWGEKQNKRGIIDTKIYLSADMVADVLLVLYVLLYINIFSRTGIRLFSGQYISKQTPSFIIPGASGAAAMLTWVLLMLIPKVKTYKKILIVGITILFSGIFMFKRGDIMRILMFTILYYMFDNKKKIFSTKFLKNIVFILLTLIIVFFSLGNLRTKMRGSGTETESDISIDNLIKGNVKMGNAGWIYAYTAINFDVLKLYYTESPENKFSTLLLPIKRISGGNKSVEDFINRPSDLMKRGINGLNGATFLSNYVLDLGILFILEIAVLGFIVAFLIRITKYYSCTGPYIFILLLTAITVMGDYYTVPNYVYSLCVGIVLDVFTIKRANYNRLVHACRQ